MILPIRLKPVELHIHADRRLAFQVLTAFGARQEDGGSSTVLKDEGDRKLVAGLAGISCCVGPTVLALLGLSSVSFAISLGNTLYYGYGWYFRGAALVLAAAGVVSLLRKRKSCTLRGAREQWRLLVTVVAAMVVVYVGLYWLTTWLARAAS